MYEFAIESSTLNNAASQNPTTLNPSTKLSAANITQALITNKKTHSETNVTGKDNINNRGFTDASKTDNKIATINAVQMVSIAIPGNMKANKKAFTVVISIRNKNFI